MKNQNIANTIDRRPNILYIMTDQQCASAMSCAGNPDLKTPAMDSIAAEGVMFEKAYCTQPVCVPSRVSMFTGKMPHETEVTYNTEDYGLSPKNGIIGKIMNEAGYDCGYAGKWHVTIPPRDIDLHGFETIFTTVPKGQRLLHGFGEQTEAADHSDFQIPEFTGKFLDRRREKPYFLFVSFTNPHDICQWARGDSLPNGDIGEAPEAEKCPLLPDNFEIPKDEPSIIRTHKSQSPKMYPSGDWQDDKWRQYRWAYYRCTELIDSLIEKVLKQARGIESTRETVIIFTSDHGDGNAAHKWNQKMVLYEEPARIPLIITTQNKKLKNTKDSTHLVSNGLDLIPTICDYAQTSPPQDLRGLSLKDIVQKGSTEKWRDYVVCETDLHHKYGQPDGNLGRMLRTDNYKYIIYSNGRGREQLFNMSIDPGEKLNLAQDKKYRSELQRHRGLLKEWCKETNDTDFISCIPE
ncbi:sulfatase [Limihaloglobus sulfuriphilus]|nr:sulfatase-like hydrolase/transferase [Limihaloglobus sulfuriphilus]